MPGNGFANLSNKADLIARPNVSNGVEYLGEGNPTLQESPEGAPFHMDDAQAKSSGGIPTPSTEWHPPPRTGLGGSQVVPARTTARDTRSPAQLMIDADLMEQDFMEGIKRAENPYGSSVEGSIDRHSGPPDWLAEYMDGQPKTDPYQQNSVMPVVDRVNSNQYLSEREKLKYLKLLKDDGKFQR